MEFFFGMLQKEDTKGVAMEGMEGFAMDAEKGNLVCGLNFVRGRQL